MKIMQVYTCGMLCYILRSTVQDDYCSCMYHCYLQVDFEESKVVGRFVVKPNVDAELDDSEWQSFVSSHQEFGIKFNYGLRRATLHFYFILKNILQLKQEARFSFIIHKTLTKLNIDLNLALGYIEKK